MRKVLMTVLCFAPPAAWADYRGEVSFGYITGDISVSESSLDYTPPPSSDPDPPPTSSPPTGSPPVEPSSFDRSSSDEDYSGWQVAGEIFFEPVDTSLGPRLLAPFMDRASSVGGAYSTIETDDTDIETETWQLFTRVVINGGWVLEGGFGQTDIDAGIFDEDVDLYRAAVAYYLAQYTQLRVGFDTEDFDGIDYDTWSIDVTHVQQLENGMTWQAQLLYADVRGDADFGDDDGSDIAVNISWFFNDAFGVGANFMTADRDSSGDTDSWEVWTNYFPTDKISLSLSYFDEDNDDFDAQNDGVVFEAKYRF